MTHEPEEPVLFDLPLAGPPAGHLPPSPAESPRSDAASRRAARRASRPASLPLFGEEEFPASQGSATGTTGSVAAEPAYVELPAPSVRGPVPVPRPVVDERPAAATAPLQRRVRAAAGDLAILIAVGGIAAVGATLLGARIGIDALPALVVFLLAFSFLYCVVSLAFWGQTPGMAWCGLIARSEETEPLSFGQTAMRWAGHWLTWALLGLPGLLALSGRSLADRMSGSSTYELGLPAASVA
ncbi:MAG: RDD family protein [Thermoanaerobaculia bacterium]